MTRLRLCDCNQELLQHFKRAKAVISVLGENICSDIHCQIINHTTQFNYISVKVLVIFIGLDLYELDKTITFTALEHLDVERQLQSV